MKAVLQIPALCAAITTAAAGLCRADDDPVFGLGVVEVTADRLGAAADTITLESPTIRANDRETVGTALNLVPGVSLSAVGARNEQMVYVRGFDLRQVPLFVDGIPVYVPYDGYVDLGRFNTFDLARIDVSKGLASLIYGPNTLGGAINLVTRRPVKSFEGEVGGGYTFDNDGRDNSYRAYTNLGSNQGSWYVQGSASYVDRRYYRLPDDFTPTAGEDGGTRNNSYARDGRISLKIGLTPNEGDEYALNYIHQHGVKGVPPYAGSVAGVSVRYWQWPYWDKDSLYAIGNKQLGDDFALKVRAYYDHFGNSLYTYDDATYTTQNRGYAFRSWYNDYSDGFSVEGDARLDTDNTLKVAYHFKNDVHREHNADEPWRTFQDITQALAAEESHAFSPKLALVTGVSYESRKTLQAEDYVSGNVVNFARGDSSDWNGQAALGYQLSATGKLTFGISAKSRFPTIKDRYSYRLGTALPNADLDAERAYHYEVRYTAAPGARFNYDLAVFHSDVKDMIQAVTIAPTACTSAPCTQMQNIGKVRMDGFEAGVNVGLGADWQVGGNYTYLSRKNRSNSSVLLTDTPRHKLFLYASGQLPWQLQFTGSVDAASKRYSSSTGSQVAAGFGVADAKLGRHFGKVLVEAGVRNLFDRLYAYSEGFPEAGRTWFVQFNAGL